VEVVDILPYAERAGRPVRGGWEAKTLAILSSPFEEVLFLDADCYPVYNPDECFEPQNNPHGIVVWPDLPNIHLGIHWPTYGLECDNHTLNGGHYLFTKRKAWPVLQLAHHYDSHSNYYYSYTIVDVKVGGLGDQEQLRVALHKLNASHTRYADVPVVSNGHSFLQAGPSGRTLFVHRIGNKFGAPKDFANPPVWAPNHLPLEATAWKYFLEWLTAPIGAAVVPE
jgi:alpha 1,2-mannosyltransferase